MSWDPFQREVLAELGHVLYRTASSEAIADELPVAASPPGGASCPDAALLARLARAASVPGDALPPEFHEPGALARLRGDGAAKRALWPSLRALRVRLP